MEENKCMDVYNYKLEKSQTKDMNMAKKRKRYERNRISSDSNRKQRHKDQLH